MVQGRKYKDNVFTVNLYHDGIFICNLLRYVEGDMKQITDVNFDGMTFNDLREIVKRLVHGLVKRLYYCNVGSPLKSILKLKSDSDVDAFLPLGYENRMYVDLYVEHHNYDVLDFLLEETSDPEIVSASSDEYCSDDESGDIDGVDFHIEGDHNVVIKNFTITDPFLNQLCSNGGSFRGFINDPILCNRGNVEEDPDGSQIDPHYKIKKVISYPKHDPTMDWDKMKPVLGTRFDHPKQLKICLANYGVANGYQLWYAKKSGFRKAENRAKELGGHSKWFWAISGIPCVHAVAGYMHLNRDPNVGVSNHPPLPPVIRRMPRRPRKNRIKAPSENNSQVSRTGIRMTYSNCLEMGHNKKTCDKDPVPKTLKTRKPPGRKSQTESVAYASSRGRGRGGTGRGRTSRGRVGQEPQQQVDEDELRNALDHEYMEHLILKEEEKRMARDKERQDGARERYYEEQRQWDFDNDYLNPKNFTLSEDEMDVDAINMTTRPINLNVNTQESATVHTASGVVEPPIGEGFHNAFDVVEPAVAEGLDQEEMIDKVVIAKEGVSVASNTRGMIKGKKIATKTETAPALPFRIYHKNRGRSERIAKMQAKKFKIDDHGTGLSADKALSLSESE
ncbi:hypothetical protein Tco_0963423 [Tanacetum coccineum]